MMSFDHVSSFFLMFKRLLEKSKVDNNKSSIFAPKNLDNAEKYM